MKATGTRIPGTQAFTILTGDGATPAVTPAPAAYETATCKTCHGADAQGQTALAPEIRHTPTIYATWVLRHGRLDPDTGMQTGMVAFADGPTMATPTLAMAQADWMNVVAWLQALPRATTPQNMYLDFCGNCHGPNRTGGFTNVSIANETVAKVQTMVRGGFGQDPSQRDLYMPAFSTTDITDAELQAIITYIGAK